MPAKCWHAPSCQGKTCRLTGEEKTFVTSYSYKANGLVPPAPSTGYHGTGSHNCHPERSEQPLRPRERSLAALGMTGGPVSGICDSGYQQGGEGRSSAVRLLHDAEHERIGNTREPLLADQ